MILWELCGMDEMTHLKLGGIVQMNSERITLQKFVDNFFDAEHPYRWRSYERPQLTPQHAKEVAQWYPIKIPYAIAVYRYDDIKEKDRFEETYGRPVVCIETKPECRRGVGYGS